MICPCSISTSILLNVVRLNNFLFLDKFFLIIPILYSINKLFLPSLRTLLRYFFTHGYVLNNNKVVFIKILKQANFKLKNSTTVRYHQNTRKNKFTLILCQTVTSTKKNSVSSLALLGLSVINIWACRSLNNQQANYNTINFKDEYII